MPDEADAVLSRIRARGPQMSPLSQLRSDYAMLNSHPWLTQRVPEGSSTSETGLQVQLLRLAVALLFLIAGAVLERGRGEW